MAENNFERIETSSIKIGIRFSAPVFFEDGENMFLAERRPVKQYHIDAIKKWSVPYLLTKGRILSENEVAFNDFLGLDTTVGELEELEELETV